MNAHLMETILELARREQERWDDPEFTHAPGTLVNESAGGAPAATAEGSEGGEGEGGEEAGEQPDYLTRDAFEERFDGLRADMAAMLQGQQPEAGQDGYVEGEQQGQEADYGQMADQLMQEFQQNGEVSPQQLEQFVEARSMEAAQQIVQQVLPQAIEQAVAPIHDRFITQEADQLEQKYPQLSEPETQRAVLQEAVLRAQNLGLDANFVRQNPAFVEETWLLKCQREGTPAVPAGGEDAALEAATATGGGGQEEPSVAAQIAAAGGSDGDMFGRAFG